MTQSIGYMGSTQFRNMKGRSCGVKASDGLEIV